MSATETSMPRAHGPKAGLPNILNDDAPSHSGAPLQLRDSGFYSTTEASNTSAASFGATGLSPTGSGYHSSQDKTPSPIASTMVPHALVSPSVSNMSVASMVSPTTPNSADPRRFDRPTSLETAVQNGHGETYTPGPLTRRESVDSRINQGFSDMRLASSPYATNNHSTTSIQNTLHRERNPRVGLEALNVHRISNGYQPSADRNPNDKMIRTAPAITGPATSHIARAAEPVKGQAWAFPDEIGPSSQYQDSRRSSFSESIASSHVTTESRLPPGQRRLDDSLEYNRMSHASAEYPSVHHHTMQHKQLSDLQSEEIMGSPGSQPYSRTPELRVSHKLAERKRRTEMKELFDQLRDLMPQERGSKASKWEILTKAIAEHQRLADHVRMMQSHYSNVLNENDALRRELQQLRGEMTSSASHGHQGPAPQQSSQPYPPSTEQFPPSNRPELPPLRAIANGPESMAGVQYDGPSPHQTGYARDHY